ncbi:hypothetical protein GIB67_040277 [Kingdonia uniflora]|uniref:Pentatricopeptide repeat-containing protein n=1 Tax=Kingdonia uniflora TaxID=39325 RepID=A0A7J7MV42_9MAGN|nr:hypothetical protein GIB67_040277 [Kingdonia uniflora]
MCFSQFLNSFKHNPPRFYSYYNKNKSFLEKRVSVDDFAFLHDANATSSSPGNTFDSSYTHTEPAYNVLLETSGFNNKVPDHFLRDIGDNDREVLTKLLNVLIRKCCRNGLWNVALEEFERLKQFGYKPSNSTYIALILVFLKADRLDTASLLHKEMSSLGFNMDGFTLGCFVQVLCNAGRWNEALTIIENEDFVPNTETYNKMISGLCEASLF